MTAVHNHNTAKTNSPTAKPTYTSTATALTNADYLMIILAQAADNIVTGSGGLGFGGGATHFEHDMLADPYLLSDGAALLVYPNTNTSATKYLPYFVWAELTADDLY